MYAKKGTDTWASTVIPSTIHTALFNAGTIDAPFLGNNENDLQWVGTTEWTYKTTFVVGQDLAGYQNMDLVFEGLDTYAEIWLNGEKILETNNMFIPWRASVQDHVKAGENVLQVHFSPPEKIEFEQENKLGYKLPGGNRVHSRKAQYQYGGIGRRNT